MSDLQYSFGNVITEIIYEYFTIRKTPITVRIIKGYYWV